MRMSLLGIVVTTALGLSGCGRSGPLELPPGPATSAPGAQLTTPTPGVAGSQQEAAAARNGFDARGNPVAPVGEKKSFILDPLLQ
jgi:predicted small lipoprotein YifL